MFTPEQKAALSAPLAPGNVKSRTQAGCSLSYIEGWKAIDEANRIFGFDAWDRETTEIRQICEPYQTNGKWRVSYLARVRIIVGDIVRDGCGYGSGIDNDVGQAHESALKEAETDAMKRALMTFGNPFGLALYDKEQRNVGEAEPERREPSRADTYLAMVPTALNNCETNDEIDDWLRSEADNRKKNGLVTGAPEMVRFGELVKTRRAAIAGGDMLRAG